jgi:hypothetical protein
LVVCADPVPSWEGKVLGLHGQLDGNKIKQTLGINIDHIYFMANSEVLYSVKISKEFFLVPLATLSLRDKLPLS